MDRVIKYGYVALFAFLLLLVSWPFLEEPIMNHGSRTDRVVALTFNDGPDQYTQGILDILSKKNVSATFFVIGEKVGVHNDTLQRILTEGHSVGIHSYAHDPEFWWAKASVKDSIGKTRELIPGDVRWYRAPFGIPSPIMKKAVEEEGLIMIGWDVNGLDYEDEKPEVIIQRVVEQVQSGSIIMLHDGHKYSNVTLAALPAIIDGVRSQGFEFVNMSSLLHQVGNGQRTRGFLS